MNPELQSDLAWLRGRGRDLTGRTFGNLEVLEYAGRSTGGSNPGMAMWSCRCKCGNVKVMHINPTRSKSCGCLSGNNQYHRKQSSTRY